MKASTLHINDAKHFVNASIDNLELFTGSFTTYKFKPHFHESYTVIFLNLGIGDYSHAGSSQVVETGGMLVLNPYDVHAGQSVKNHPWHFSSMYISQKIMKRAMASMGYPNQLPVFQAPIIEDKKIFQKGHAAFPNLIYGNDHIASEHLLIKFLQALIEKHACQKPTKSKAAKGFEEAQLVREYLHLNYLNEVSIKELAQMTGMPEYGLVRTFKKHFHLPPRQYLLNLRIEQAKKLLAQRYSSTEVAYRSGFFDQSHFIRHFKKFIGITPKQFASKVG